MSIIFLLALGGAAVAAIVGVIVLIVCLSKDK